LAHKTENLDIKDAPDRLIPSAEKIDKKLESAQESLESARTAQVGDKDLSKYPKIQQVFKDTQNVLQSNRDVLKDKVGDDDTLKNTVQHVADLASLVVDQSSFSIDSLWTNWAALLGVVAGAGAGSWKSIALESWNIFGQLKHTQEFIKLLGDVQNAFTSISTHALEKKPIVGDKLEAFNKDWEKSRDTLLADFKKIWAILNESPLWRQLVAKGKALGTQAAKVGEDTKEEAEKSAQTIANSEEVKKLKEDFKNVLQLIVGKDGPSVEPFLDYCGYAYGDIIENEQFSKLASGMSELFETINKTSQSENPEAYEKQFEQLHSQTKELLDLTVKNSNLKLALRESKKLIRSAKKDPATKKLLENTNKLITHISDKKGISALDPQLINEIRAVVVPILVSHFDNAPLPDYHGRDTNALGTFQYSLSEIRLGALGIVPSNVKVEFRYKLEADPSKASVSRQKTLMYLEASDIQVAFKDVKWAYHRNTIPRVSDQGTIDIATAGKGVVLKVKAEMHNYEAPSGPSSLGDLLAPPKEHKMFEVLRAECTIDDFQVRVSDAGGANVFYKMLAGLWGTKIKHQIEHLVEDKMTLLANKFDSQLYEIVKRATQPTLGEQAKDTLLSAGKAAGDKIAETAQDVKQSIDKM